MDVGLYGQELGMLFSGLWERMAVVIPGIIAAIIVLLLGYFIAWLLSFLTERALHSLKLDKWLIHELGGKDFIGKFKLSSFISHVVRWYVFIMFFPTAAEVIKLESLSILLMDLFTWIPNLIASIVIVIIGIISANYVRAKINHFSFQHAKQVAIITKVIILIFTFIIALEQVGINMSFAANSFLIILAGIMLSLAIAFGYGLRPEIEKSIKKWKKHL